METLFTVLGMGALMTVGMAILFVLAKASIKLNDLTILASNAIAGSIYRTFKRESARKQETIAE